MRQSRIESTSSRRLLTAGSPASAAPLLPRGHYRWRFRFRPLALPHPSYRQGRSRVSTRQRRAPTPKAGEPALTLRRRELAKPSRQAGGFQTQLPCGSPPATATELPRGSSEFRDPGHHLPFSLLPVAPCHCKHPEDKPNLPCSRVLHCSGQPDHIKTSQG